MSITINNVNSAIFAKNNTVNMNISTTELGDFDINIDINDSEVYDHILYLKDWVKNNTSLIEAYIPPDMASEVLRLAGILKMDIKHRFNMDSQKPRVDTGLGFFVDGGRNNLQDFQTCAALGVLTLKDADNNFQVVTSAELDTIISAIQANGLNVYQAKWDKEQIIDDIVNDTVLTDLEKITQLETL